MKTNLRIPTAIRLIGMLLIVALAASAQATRRPSTVPPKTAPRAQPASAPSQTLNVTVLPFKQSVGSAETVALGAGVADSVSNALKAVSKLVVTDGDVVVQAATKAEPPKDLFKDDEAIAIGTQLNLQFMVTGTYQSLGNQLLIDARILNVITGKPLPGAAITASGKFPDEYASVLQGLASKIIAGLQIPVSVNERGNVTGALSAPKTAEAQNAFIRANARIRATP